MAAHGSKLASCYTTPLGQEQKAGASVNLNFLKCTGPCHDLGGVWEQQEGKLASDAQQGSSRAGWLGGWDPVNK